MCAPGLTDSYLFLSDGWEALDKERLPITTGWRNNQRMTDQAEQVSDTGLVDTKQRPGLTKRRQYSEALKRQIVAETVEPVSSVSIVARRHDVNSNQLFKWRRELLPKAGPAGGARAVGAAQIVPAPPRRPRGGGQGIIEIEFYSGAAVTPRRQVVPAGAF